MSIRFIVCIIAFVSPVAAAISQTPQSIKTYRDSTTAVSFIYPDNWTSDPNSLFSADSALLLKPESERKPTDPTAYDIAHAKIGFRFHAPQTDREAGGAAFLYALLPEADDAGCRRRATRAFGEDEKSADSVTIGDIVYTHASPSDSGLGHSRHREIYVTFLGGECYGFEEQIDTFHVDGWSEAALVKKSTLELAATMQSVRISSPLASLMGCSAQNPLMSGLALEIMPGSLSYRLSDPIDLVITVKNTSSTQKDFYFDDLYGGLHIVVAGQDGTTLRKEAEADSNHDREMARQNGQTFNDGLRGLVKGLSTSGGSGIHLAPGQSLTMSKPLQYFKIPIRYPGAYTIGGIASLLVYSDNPWSSCVLLLSSGSNTIRVEK